MFAGANFFRRVYASEVDADHANRVQDVDVYEQSIPDHRDERRLKRCWEKAGPKLKALIFGSKDSNAALLPKDYYFNSQYHPDLIAPLKIYLSISFKANHLVNGDYFNNIVTFTIVIAGILVGVQTYDSMTDSFVVDVLDYVVLGIFTFECCTKIIMEGLEPWMYFVGPEWKWNCFDFAIVLLSFPFWGSVFAGSSSIALLRLVRLARLGKLIKKIHALQMIVKGLIGGLSSISYIMILIFLVYYLYGVMGYYLFAGNDPFHFGTLADAMITLFRISTLDNWGDIMYINYFGCDYYPDLYVSPMDKTPRNKKLWCDHSNASPYLASLYFVSFVVVSALVMLSLFIGAVTLSMTESMEDLKKTMEEKKKKAAFAKNKKQMSQKKLGTVRVGTPTGSKGNSFKLQTNSNSDISPLQTKVESSNKVSVAGDNDGNDGDGDGGTDSVTDSDESVDYNTKLVEMKDKAPRYPFLWPYILFLNYKIWNEARKAREQSVVLGAALRVAIGETHSLASEAADAEGGEGIDVEGQSVTTHVGHDGLTHHNDNETKHMLLDSYLFLSKICIKVVENKYFNHMMTFVICVASVNVGAQTDNRILRVAVLAEALDLVDLTILSIFTIEIVLKVIGEGIYPWRYFKDGWNKFDFFIVVASYVPGAGSTVTILRLLRLLRILKLVKRLPQLAIIVNALLMSMSSIGYVGLVLFLFFYVFAIIGMILFQENDPWHFGSLHAALIALFRIATLDNSTEIQYLNMFGCERYLDVYGSYPAQCKNTSSNPYVASIYFLTFTIIGAQVLLSLFIGVISTSMDNAREKREVEDALDEKLLKTAQHFLLTRDRIEAFKVVFSMLDLDGGGTIEEEELKIGLSAIGMDLAEDEILSILASVDESGEGEVDADGFIRFLFKTPVLKDELNRINITRVFSKSSTKAVKKEPWYQSIMDTVQYGGRDVRIKVMELESAYIIQEAWEHFKIKQAAKKEVERKKEEKLRLEAAEAESHNNIIHGSKP